MEKKLTNGVKSLKGSFNNPEIEDYKKALEKVLLRKYFQEKKDLNPSR